MDDKTSSSDPSRRSFLTSGLAAAGGVATGALAVSEAQARDDDRTNECATANASGPLKASAQDLQGLERLISRILGEPRLVEDLFENPKRVAASVCVTLTDREAAQIKNLSRESRSKVRRWAGEFQSQPVDP